MNIGNRTPEPVARNREIARLVQVEGLLYKEIAPQFGISIMRVCQIVRREKERQVEGRL